MATVTVQMGHCFRTTGKTGGRGEQAFTQAVAERLAPLLEDRGHRVQVVKADERARQGDAFVALHTDGSANTAARGASTGFPDDEGARLARAWKRAHQRAGFPGGFLSDNRTADQQGYYGFGDHAGHRFRFLAEHGMHSHDGEFEWLHSHFDACADAHVAALSEVLGDPVPPASGPTVPVPPGPAPSLPQAGERVEAFELTDGSVISFSADGGVFVEGDPSHHKGDMAGRPMNAPVVGAAMADGDAGYWLVGADGGIFTFAAPPIQPYAALQREFRAGQRRVVRARRRGPGLLLLSNRGERYVLEPVVAGRRTTSRARPLIV